MGFVFEVLFNIEKGRQKSVGCGVCDYNKLKSRNLYLVVCRRNPNLQQKSIWAICKQRRIFVPWNRQGTACSIQ